MKCDELLGIVEGMLANGEPVPVDYAAILIGNGYNYSQIEGKYQSWQRQP